MAGAIAVTAFGLGDEALGARYDRLHADCPAAYIQQSTHWARVVAPLGPDEPIFLLASNAAGDVAGLPLYLFRAAPGAILTSVPQPGPLGGIFSRSEADRDAVYRHLLAAAADLAQRHRCLTLTIITDPLADDVDFYRRHLAPDFEFENFTQVVPVARAVQDDRFILPNNPERNPGRTIRKARSCGFTTAICDDPALFARWYAVHRRRHGELGLTPLAEALLGGLWRHLAPLGKAFLMLVLAGDEIASGCLFVCHRDVCDAYILSANSAFAAQAPNYLLIEQALLLMARRGIRWMNWQSSARRGDGVYRFKAQWGSDERPYAIVTKLYGDPQSLLALGGEGVRRHYPNHYVVPFAAFAQGLAPGRFAKP